MKRINHISSMLNKVVKHSYLLLLFTPFTSYAAERSGLLLNAGLTAEYTDNVLNNIDETSDTAIVFSPDIKYLSLIGKHKFALSYKGSFANYTKDSDLSYNEHIIALGARLDHSNKIDTEFKIGFDKKIEEPGSTNSSTLSLTNFNKYENKSALARLYFGKKTSIGQIVLEYKYNEREYTNNQQNYRDFEQDQFIATFFYRLAPKTRLLFQASTADYSYDDQQLFNGIIFNQSSTQNLYLTGVEWEATAKTTGIFKIGYQDKDYDDPRFNDISGLSYNLDMIWKPNTYTKIKLGATRQTTESAQLDVGGFVSTSYSIDLSHDIFVRTALTAKYIVDNDDIVSSINFSDRTDKRNKIQFGIKHNLRKWLDVSLNYKYQEKSSNLDIFNYDSNAVELTFTTVFE